MSLEKNCNSTRILVVCPSLLIILASHTVSFTQIMTYFSRCWTSKMVERDRLGLAEAAQQLADVFQQLLVLLQQQLRLFLNITRKIPV